MARNEIAEIIYDSSRLHTKIVKITEKLFKNGHYPQAILEAFKMINLEVKRRTKIDDRDGANLMHHVFNENKPILKLNKLRTLSEKDEQYGFRFIFAGSMTGIRNPEAHEIKKIKDPFITLEYLSLASLLMKMIDKAKKVKVYRT